MAAPDHRAAPAGLTAAQREAIGAPDPVLCVLAGAGAGKTRVLTLRVARRIHDGSAARGRVLVCTFSRKAADELRRRLWTLEVGTEVEAGTFHRTALQLLRQYRADHGKAAPVLLADRRAALARLLDGGPARDRRVGSATAARNPPGAGPDPRRRRTGAVQLEGEISWAKARLVTPDDYEEAARGARRRAAMGSARVAELYARYEAAKRRQGMLDLDDLLWVSADLLEGDPRFAAAVRWRHRHVFVDEMQDVNPAQFRLLQALVGEEPDLCVVGDPNQSVYGWNGADPSLLDRLPEIFPGTRVCNLDENHRCSPQVVAVAAAALGLDGDQAPTSARRDGPVPRIVEHPTDRDEAAWVAREAWLAHRSGRRWEQTAVLARTNAQLAVVAGALEVERVPFRYAGGDVGPASDVPREVAPSPRGHDASGSGAGGDGGGGDGGDGVADGDPADSVVLSTFHRAKGLQWPTVFVVGLSDGLVPIASARTAGARAEERRLLYVAVTRAEQELTCTWAAHHDTWERESGAPARRPSPWVEEMERARAALLAEVGPPDPDRVRAQLAGVRARLGDAGR